MLFACFRSTEHQNSRRKETKYILLVLNSYHLTQWLGSFFGLVRERSHAHAHVSGMGGGSEGDGERES